jgi:hypothetical protein
MDDINENNPEKIILNLPCFKINCYLDIELLKKYTPNLNYILEEDKKLEKYCTEQVFNHVMSKKKKLFESKNCKKLVRSGVPLKFIRDLILKLLDIYENPKMRIDYYISTYKNLAESVLKNNCSKSMGDYVPNFTEFETINECLPVNFLNEKGFYILKETLWIINSIKNDMDFSPFIIKIVKLLLIIFSQEETYAIMRNLIELNKDIKDTKQINKIRWHFRFNLEENNKIIVSFMESLKNISNKTGKQIFQHFEKINFSPEKLFEDMIYGFFMDYLNFSAILRLLPLFFREGVKSLYRIGFALMKYLRLEILKINNPDNIIKIIRIKSKEIYDLNKLYELAYSYKLNRNNNKYKLDMSSSYAISSFTYTKRNMYYLPKNIESNILSNKEFLKMWSQLPILLRPNDPIRIYNANMDGYSLRKIYNLAENYEMKQGLFFFIETINNEAFGGFISNFFTPTRGKFIRPLETYLISIRPNQHFYSLNINTDNILRCDHDFIMFGNGKDGPAIFIKGDLNSGISNPNNCFCKERLVKKDDGYFEIRKFEVFLLE